MSGFFFCGMMLDPVDHESCSVTNPNSLVDHRMISSASRLRSTPTWAATKASSATKSRDGRAVDRVGRRVVEAELAGDGVRVEAEAGAGQGAGAVRRVGGDAAVPVAQPLDVAQQRPGVGEQVVGQQHGLGVLQVRASRHHHVEVAARLVGERVDEVERAARRSACAWSRRNILNSVATWSLRLRPARSRPPTSSPTSAISSRSRAPCTSSSDGSGGSDAVGVPLARARASPAQQRRVVVVGEQPGARAGRWRGRASRRGRRA